MEVLIVGGGGREHALAWHIARSPQVARVFVAPGNAGTALEPKVTNIAIGADAIDELVAFARQRGVGLTVVGPEGPLVAGIVDAFAAEKLPCLGPNRSAARLEGSKAFAKGFLARHGIPTATFATFDDPAAARDYLASRPLPIVVKADGLAAGKGVIIAHSRAEALEAVEAMVVGGAFGGAGRRVVIEDFREGEEASFMVLCDGRHALPLASSQDHKARDDGDRGPNTGGMGAYSPAPVVEGLEQRIMDTIVHPTLAGLAAEGITYRGFLYAGLMIDAKGDPKVLEYNCRLGDPETQPLMLRLQSDLVELARRALAGDLAGLAVHWDPRSALGVVLAAEGYPEAPVTGAPIGHFPPPNADPDLVVFHAGTRNHGDAIVTSGGRILCVTAKGTDLEGARERAYAALATIHCPGSFHRRDIGHRALGRAP
ncbi:MAG: phosphoribosylamine--glycine ligase [Candidatus Competibacterales bacterium]